MNDLGGPPSGMGGSARPRLSCRITSWVLFAAVLNPSPYTHAQGGTAAPQFHYAATLGCHDVFLHAVNASKTEYLRIEVDFARFTNSGSRQRLDLANAPPNVVVEVAVYERPQINRPNCSDVFTTEVGEPPNPPGRWRAIAGTLEVERGPKGVRPEEPWLFRATLRLSNASFRGPQGAVIDMPDVFTWEGFVGWQAGSAPEAQDVKP